VGAIALAARQPTKQRTYGFRRSTILASLINAIVLLVTFGGIAWEAVRRFAEPAQVSESTVIWVAAIGIGVNAFTAALFLSGRKGDLNIRGAFLHMASDAAVSLGVVVSGAAILFTGWYWLDLVVSLGIVVVVIVGTWGLLRESINLALDAVPEDINAAQVQAYLTQLPTVTGVHDLHIWGMSTTEAALTAHLVLSIPTQPDELLSRVCQELHDNYGIEHTTIQVESEGSPFPCALACDDKVYP
jgi:cobalt-zinc-cadmium efflux system protein